MLWNLPHLLAVVGWLGPGLASDSGGGRLGSEVLNTVHLNSENTGLKLTGLALLALSL